MRNARTVLSAVVAGSLALSAAGQGEGTLPAHYLVFEARAGRAEARYATRVELRAPLSSLTEAQVAAALGAATRLEDRLAVSLTDAGGQVVHRGLARLPRWRRGEFQRAFATPGQSNIDAHVLPLDPAVFVVRVPVAPGATLHLEGGPVTAPASFDLDRLAADPALQPPPLDVVASQAPAVFPANRVDLLIMGDGYTAAQQSQFQADAQGLASSFLGITPFSEYRNYVNLLTLFTASPESGADQPPYDAACPQNARVQTCCGDASAQGEGSAFVATPFDGTYCSFNIQRLATVDDAKVFIAAAAVPDWDEILLIMNDPTYGGSGGAVATVSRHSLATGIAQHEYGHSFGLLADEYSSPYPGYPACSDVTALPDCERNVTDQTTRELIRWNRWIAPATPVPTTEPPPVPTQAGLWEGARYLSTGMYRQGYNCLMRVLGAPFCDVAAEAYALRLYEGGWGVPAAGIRNVEPGTASPAGGVTVVSGTTTPFSAQVLGPLGGPALSVAWSVDGGTVVTGTADTGTTASYNYTAGTPGLHTVSLRVTDNSPIVHPTLRGSLATVQGWSVTVISDIIFRDGFQ